MSSVLHLIFPEVAAPGESVGGPHPTANLPGYPARDFFAPAGVPAVAPEPGTITRLSGRDPSLPPTGPGGAWGLSEYLHGQSGTDYFITHLGTRTVKEGDTVKAGSVLGTVGAFPGGTPSHLHIGTTGPVTAEQLAAAPKIAASDAFQGGTGSRDPNTLYDPATGAPLPGQSGSFVPGVDALKGPLGSIGDLIGWLSNPRNLLRMLEIGFGAVLTVLGLLMVTRGMTAAQAYGASVGRVDNAARRRVTSRMVAE